MAEHRPGRQNRKSFTVLTLELDWESKGEVDKVFSCLAVLFCSTDEEGVAGDVFSAECKIDEFSADSRIESSGDCGRVLWSIDEEGVVTMAGVLLLDIFSQAFDPEGRLGSEGMDSVIVLTTQLPSTLVLLSQMASAKAVGVISTVALSGAASHDAVAWLG